MARVVAPLVMAMSLLVHLLLQILLNVTSSTVCLFWCTHCYKVTSPEQQWLLFVTTAWFLIRSTLYWTVFTQRCHSSQDAMIGHQLHCPDTENVLTWSVPTKRSHCMPECAVLSTAVVASRTTNLTWQCRLMCIPSSVSCILCCTHAAGSRPADLTLRSFCCPSR